MTHTCSKCGRSIRARSVRAADAPGTVQGYIRKGLCVVCDKGERKNADKLTVVPCSMCGKKTRPQGTLKKDWPDTVARGKSGLCQSDYERMQRGNERRAPAWLEDAALALEVHPLPPEVQLAAARNVVRAGGDTMILEALGLLEVYAEVR